MGDCLKSARERPPQTKVLKAKPPETIEHRLRQFAPSINKFGCSVFRKLLSNADLTGDCVGISPAGLFIQLGALMKSSTEDDAETVAKSAFGHLPNDFDKLVKEMAVQSDHRSNYKWYMALGLFTPNQRSLNGTFIESLESKYGVHVQKLDLRQSNWSRAVDIIKEFVREQTEEHVKDIVTVENGLPGRYLESILGVNAVYLHPWWRSRFERSKTYDSVFYETASKTHPTSMMRRESVLQYTEAEISEKIRIRMVGLPCRRNVATLYFILPTNRLGLSEVLPHLTSDRLGNLVGFCRDRTVKLSIPKLRVSSITYLRESLVGLGMRPWFDVNHPALYSLLKGSGSLSIGQLVHKVVLRLNEDGDRFDDDDEESEADEHAGGPVEFTCDEPFLVLFHHKLTNAFWMLLSIYRPTYLS